MEMDAVDREQQRQIDANRVWTRVIGALTTLLLIFGVALFGMVMETVSGGGCPHTDCPHNKSYSANAEAVAE